MIPTQGTAIRWFFVATVCIVAGWLVLKNACYQHYQYAYDIFSSLDMSRSWLNGHALLYETRYGDHARLHNYYLHPLLSPFTATLGAFGLLLAHALVLALCLFVILRSSRGADPERRFCLAVWVLTFFLGPFGFWIWDDPFFGWHVELLFVPMAVLFGASLMQERLWLKLVAGAVLVSMREDGCVVACCVHLFWYWATRTGRGLPGSGRHLIGMCAIAAGWLAVFGAGMWFLAYKNDFQETRAGAALGQLRKVPWEQTREHLRAVATEILPMLAPTAVFALLFFRLRYLIAMVILTLPLLAVSLVAALYTLRSGTTSYGLTWNPRFALVLGFQSFCMVYMILRGEFSWVLRRLPAKTVYVAGCVLLAFLQWRALCDVRYFGSDVERYVAALTAPPEKEVRTLKRLATMIPRNAYVSAPAIYYALFEWHRYVWIDYGALVNAPVKEPDVVIVLDTAHLQAVDPGLYTKDRCGSLTIWHKPSLKLDLRWCSAHMAPGHAVVLRRPAGTAAIMTLVDPAGGATDIRGLDPETVGTGGLDGARSVIVAESGVLFAGVGLDNRGSAVPAPLHLRRIVLNGDTVSTDEAFATLMLVPPDEAWHVSDIKERAEGSLLVAVTRTVSAAAERNGAPRGGASAALIVDASGGVSALAPAAMPPGSLLGIADAGDRCVCAFARGVSGTDVEVVSLPFAAGGPAPFRVHEFAGTAGFGGMDVDADGTLVLALAPNSASVPVVRLPHTRDSTPAHVSGRAGSMRACAMNPASGLVAGFREGTLILVDTLAAMTTVWSTSTLPDPVYLSVKANPLRYGTASPSGPSTPYLGSFGGLPEHGNQSFGVRIGGTPGAGGVLLLGVGRADLPTPFGRFLLDPAGSILVIAPVSLPESGSARLRLPLSADPATAGTTVNLQAVLFSGPLRAEMTAGLEITIQ